MKGGALQQALIYAAGMFIDKSATLSCWSTLLDPTHSTLSKTKREEMAHYMVYDCIATTYLVKPVLEYWTFEELTKINIVELFLTSKSSSIINNDNNKTINNIKKISKNINGQTLLNVIEDDLEPISDEENDEIQLNQCVSSMINNDDLYELISSDSDDDKAPLSTQNIQNISERNQLYEDVSDDDQAIQIINDNNEDIVTFNEIQHIEPSSSLQRRSIHRTRTREAKHRRNQKRNKVHKKNRFRFFIKRPVYNRFPMALIRIILRRYRVYFVHTKIVEDELVIGLKNNSIRSEAEHQLPRDLFNRQSYYYYRRQYRSE